MIDQLSASDVMNWLLISLAIAVAFALYFLRAGRRTRLISKYMALHAHLPGPGNEIEEWVIAKVDEIWFDSKESSRLRPAMKIGNIHMIWYKGAWGDGMECEQLIMDAETNYGIEFGTEEFAGDVTIGQFAEKVGRLISAQKKG